MNRHAQFRKRARDYAFRELRSLAGAVEFHAERARSAPYPGWHSDYTLAQEYAAQAEKIAREYSRFIANGSYL